MVNESRLDSFADWGIKEFVDLMLPAIRCPLCGFPLRVCGQIRLRGNGTISPVLIKSFMRIVLIPTGLYDRLTWVLEESLGIPIGHILFEAQRNINRSIIDSFSKVIPFFRLLNKSDLTRRIIVEGLNRAGVILGAGYGTRVEYVPDESVVFRVRNPYNINLAVANVLGTMESFEGHPYDYEISDEGNQSYLVKSKRTSDKPAISERLHIEKPVLIRGSKGNIKYEKCRLCRTPRVFSSRFTWIDDEGIIIDTQSDTRVVVMDGFLLNTVLRELVKELGEEVYSMLVSAQRDWTMEHVGKLGLAPGESNLKEKEFEGAFKDYLDDLPVFGYGNPVLFTVDGSSVEVIVENPFQEEVIAGTLQGLYQVFSGLECRISWETIRKATVSYSIEPA